MNKQYKPYLILISIKRIIFNGKKVWLRKNERQEWELPGAKLDEGEQPEEAVEREMKEELGFEIRAERIIQAYLYRVEKSIDESAGVLVISYACDIIKKSGEFELEGEAGQAEFQAFDLEEVRGLNMPDFYKEAIEKAEKIKV